MDTIVNALCCNTVLHSPSHEYRILKALGQGGFGITYVAETDVIVTSKIQGELGTFEKTHTEHMQVCVKEFFMKDINGRNGTNVTTSQKDGVHQKYYNKFKAEAKNLSQLQHDNIISVIELFETNNTLYYSMEYVEGGSLDNYIKSKGRLLEEETISSIRQIANALIFMHKHKMLHLDLKPNNILRKKTGQLVLIDFGLSKQYDEKGEPESSTSIGAGTPGYAPLEQTDFHGGRDFPKTLDIYALGATMFKMLTGQTPPVASDIMNFGLPETEMRNLGVSDNTIRVVKKCMNSRKTERFQSVNDVVNALDNKLMIDSDETTAVVQQSVNNVVKFANGTYQGELKGGRPHGQGEFFYKDGDYVKGVWNNGELKKCIQYRWASGKVYEGDWVGGNMHGQGKLTYTDGRIYEGQFVNGLRDGKGVLTYPNGKKFVGEFKNDNKTEKGSMFNANGKKTSVLKEKTKDNLRTFFLFLLALLAAGFLIFLFFGTYLLNQL